MIAIVVFGILFGALLVLALARWGTNPAVIAARQARGGGHSGVRVRVEQTRFRLLVIELLTAMGFQIEREGEGDERRLVALKPDPFGPVRYVAFVEAAPPGDRVEVARVLELGEEVKSQRAALGLLFTPFALGTGVAGVDVPVEIFDGQRFRQLIGRHLPARLGELDRYVGFEPRPVPPRPFASQPA
jgi:hypothetical protein